MATTVNYFPLDDRLNIYDSTYSRVDAQSYTTDWQALNATVRVTDDPVAIMDIDYYTLEILPTNPGKVTLFLNNVVIPSFMMLREMIFHCQVKCSVEVDTSTSLFETGQPMGIMVPKTQKTTRDQFVTVRSNIWVLPKNKPDKTATIEVDFENHEGGIIYLTVPVLIDHLDFYKNSVVRSARTLIPDAYWRLDFEQSDPQFPMYKLLDALTNSSNDVMQLFSNWFDHELDELAPGLDGTETWAKSTLTDPSLASEGNMDWLAQFTGSILKGNITGTDQPAGTTRDFYTTADDIEAFLKWQLENSYYGRASGTREAMIAAAQQVLSGTKGVAVLPHYSGSAWKIQIQTLRSETEDFHAGTGSSDDVLDAVAQAAPMGYEIFHMAVLFFAFTLGNVGLGRLGLGVLGGPGGYVPPDEPTGLTISAGGTPSTELTLTWVAPAYNGGDVVSSYVIRRDGSIINGSTGNTNVTYTDTGLSPGTAYSYTVAAINGAGAGDQSTSASGTTDAVVPGVPTNLTLVVGATPSSMIDLSWTVPADQGGSAVAGYRITQNRAGAGDVVIVGNTGTNATTYTATGLDRVTSYAYKVAAINAAGIGSDCTPVSLTTSPEVPGAPGTLALSAGSPSQTNILLTWSAPSDNGGGALIGYRIKKDGSTIVADTGNTNTNYTVTGLTRYTEYNFNVAAINSRGTGSDGNTPSLYTDPEQCAAPTITATADNEAFTIDLSWTIPDAGGGTISGYHIKRDGSTLIANTGTTATTYADTGLTINTTYSYTIAAINQLGDGVFSSADTAKTITIIVTGGDITYYGNYKVHTFTGSANLVVSSNVSGTVTADVLVVSGGGSSDSPQWGYQKAFCTGGAGGGGVVESTQVLAASTNYFAQVGAGGTVGGGNSNGEHGGTGQFGSQSQVYGGGRSNAYQNSGVATLTDGGGGQGGGARVSTNGGIFEDEFAGKTGGTNGRSGGDGKCGTVTNNNHYTYGGGGGGGGSGGVDGDDATDAVTGPGGDGGNGMQNDYQTGSNQYYGGGGGGAGVIGGQMANCEVPSAAAVGGQGGGGTGGHSAWSTTAEGQGSGSRCSNIYKTDATAGLANTGGGGGGGGEGSFYSHGSSYDRGQGPDGGAGGSGIVIVRYVHIRP